ncbi:MAG: hypothetical protein P8X89_08755 [Reinekea sp.]|jgi:hypothetical protein
MACALRRYGVTASGVSDFIPFAMFNRLFFNHLSIAASKQSNKNHMKN